MTRFRFSLERVLEFRRKQLQAEESRLHQRQSAIADLDRRRSEIEASAAQAETELRNAPKMDGSDLMAMGAYRLRAKEQCREIAGKRSDCEREREEQRRLVMEARRRVRLLERLKERRRAEWQTAADKETAETAAESFLARWSRER